jgi:hypothetical protein
MPGSRRKFNELEQLAQSCEPASLGVDEEAMTATDHSTVTMEGTWDEIIHRASGAQQEQYVFHYHLHPFEHHQTLKSLELPTQMEDLSPSLASNPPPPSEGNGLGSLVIIFPTPHDGGVL